MSLDADDLLLSESDIIERVDEYTLYCHYLQFEPQFGVKYTSPIREQNQDYDDNPSFGIFFSRVRNDVEYMWKDQGKGIHGDIFDLVRRLFRLPTRQRAVEKIAGDFDLIPGKIVGNRIPVIIPPPPLNFNIRVKSRPMNDRDLMWWARFNIDLLVLQYYNTTAIMAYWMTEEQATPRFPRTPGYAYRIWDKYKLYFPFEHKDFKFRNNFDDRHLEGFPQLRFNSDLLVITKSNKDNMLLRTMGIEAVSPRGEHTLIPDEYIRLFKERYRFIVTLMDNDGKHKAEEYQRLYGIPPIFIPKESGEKDPTDFCARYGYAHTEELVSNLIYDKIGTRSFIRSYIPR